MRNLFKIDKKYGFNYSKYDQIFQVVAKILNPSKKEIILDAGCGIGLITNYLPNTKFIGVDIDKDALKVASKKKQYIKTYKASLAKLPFRKKQFKKAISIQTLYYIPEWKKAVDELARVTDDLFIVTIPNFFYNFFKKPSLWIKKLKNPRAKYWEFFSKVSIKQFKEYIKDYNYHQVVVSKDFVWLRRRLFCNEYVFIIKKKN